MAVGPSRVTPARIGNSSGLRLPAAFYRDHPQFAGAAGQMEVLDDSTLLLRLEPEEQQQGEAQEDNLRPRLGSRPIREGEGDQHDVVAAQHQLALIASPSEKL